MKTALICGISGQDGAYLAELLLKKGYRVFGTSRDAQISPFHNLDRLGIREAVEVRSMSPIDFRSVLQTLTQVQPDEVYNLSGQSSVGLSFHQPVETLDSISVGTLTILEAIRFTNQPIRFYNASSGECFGETGGEGSDERTPFRPRSPYAVAKSAAFWEVANYREAYGLHASSGILFNHESPLRPDRFVTRKIVTAACRVAAGKQKVVTLGNLSICRDWGWAPEYVDAMWRILQQDRADDFVIATGESHTLEAFVAAAFSRVGLDWTEHVVVDDTLFRPTDIQVGRGDPRKAADVLGWRATYKMADVVRMMVEAELAEADRQPERSAAAARSATS